MSRHHHDEIDRAVHVAHRAATAGHLTEPDRLTRLLYRRWFLGVAGPRGAQVPAQRRRAGGASPSEAHTPNAQAQAYAQPWRTWGPAWPERTTRGADLVRLHLSCAPHTSLHALAAVAARARTWDHPWLLTSRAVNQAVPQPDATLLLLPVDALDDLRRELELLVDEVQPFLAGTVPALTLKVARGVTLAQNPGDGRGFGEHRCALIAEAVLGSLHRPHHERVRRTLRAFAAAQVDPDHPYRALGATWSWSRRRIAA